jgi:integrase
MTMAKAQGFSDKELKNWPLPEKRQEIAVPGETKHLYWFVSTSGHKSWVLRYKWPIGKGADGKTAYRIDKVRLGTYPTTSLAMAREKAKPLNGYLEEKPPRNPRDVLRAEQEQQNDISRRFDAVARLFLERHAKAKNRSWKETARQLGLVPDKTLAPEHADDPHSFATVNGSAVGKWGQRQLGEISRAEVIALLDHIKAHGGPNSRGKEGGAPILANRTLAALRKLFNWAVGRDLIGKSPCDGIEAPAAEVERDRVLSDAELKAVWQASEALGWPFGRVFQTLILTGQRKDMVGAMEWRELDLAKRTWSIPGGRIKAAKPHEVPLSEPALEVLEKLPRIDGAGLVFTTNGRTPVSGFSKAKAALDAKMLAILQEADPATVTLEPFTIHDFRRTAATGMQRLGINLPVIEKVLDHKSGSFRGIVGVYQRYGFAEEKRAALDAWGRFVTGLVSGAPASNVVPIRA